MTDEKMLELAQRAGVVRAKGDWCIFDESELRKFAGLVRRDALDEAVQKISALFVRNAKSEWGNGYAQAQRDIHEGIRALAAQEGDK